MHSVLLRKFIFACALVVSLGYAPQSHSAELCAQIHRAGPSKAALQAVDLSKVEDLLTRKMLSESNRRLESLRNLSKNSVETEAVVVGAGLHASIFAATAAQESRAQGLLVIEGGSVVSKNFGQVGGTFIINSPELSGGSTNIFSGSPLEMKELSADVYPDSMAMSVMGLGALYSADVPVLFNNQITNVSRTADGSRFRYQLETSSGLMVYANQIFFGTGLGEASLPMKDASTLSLVKGFAAASKSKPDSLLPVMLSDDFHRMLKLQAHSNLKKSTQGKSFAVIGSGDGGKIAIEAMLSRFAKNIHIEWIGMSAQTREEYENSTWERYFSIGPFFGKTVFGRPGRAESILKTNSGKYIVRYGNGQIAEVDYVILATGFRDVIPDMFKEFSGSEDTQVTKVPVRNSRTVIGSQLAVNGQLQDGLYVIGPAAGQLATEAELKLSETGNPVSVEVLGPRTAEMTKLLPQIVSKAALLNGATTAHSFMLARSSNSRFIGMGKDSLRIMLKLEITKLLRHLSRTDLSVLRIEIKSGSQEALVRINSLQKAGLDEIQKAFQSSTFLQNLVQEILRRNSEGIVVEIPARRGKLSWTQMQIQLGLE